MRQRGVALRAQILELDRKGYDPGFAFISRVTLGILLAYLCLSFFLVIQMLIPTSGLLGGLNHLIHVTFLEEFT